jgi:hypothetical protein
VEAGRGPSAQATVAATEAAQCAAALVHAAMLACPRSPAGAACARRRCCLAGATSAARAAAFACRPPRSLACVLVLQWCGVLLVSLLVGTGMNGGSTGGRGKDKGEREKIDHICYLKTPLCEVVSKDRFLLMWSL